MKEHIIPSNTVFNSASMFDENASGVLLVIVIQ